MRRRIIASILAILVSTILLTSACAASISFSASTTQNTTSIAASTAPGSSPQTYEPAVSKEQAIAIASPYLPAKIILQSKVTAQQEFNQFSVHIWQVSFEGFSATGDELVAVGWEAGNHTSFLDFPGAEYHFAYFNIDSDTGKLLIKAVNVLPGGPGPETTSVFWLPSERPIEVISLYVPNGPPIPAGPFMEISIESVGTQAITQLSIGLGVAITRPNFFEFSFDINTLNPLLPGRTRSASRTMIGASYVEGQYYPVFISGSFQDGTTFDYTQYIQISKYATTLPTLP